ncbi:hypothetical protein [Desulfovibrio sp. ZJ200]|nr:hypothetical protein [Desulfovibrio sp. ZJ200]
MVFRLIRRGRPLPRPPEQFQSEIALEQITFDFHKKSKVICSNKISKTL